MTAKKRSLKTGHKRARREAGVRGSIASGGQAAEEVLAFRTRQRQIANAIVGV